MQDTSRIRCALEPLTRGQIAKRKAAIDASQTLIDRIRARRQGKPLSESWPLIREARDQRSAEI